MNRKYTLHIRSLALAAAAIVAGCDVEDVAFHAPPMIAVTVGEAHSCALLQSGGANCWGDGTSGQLGSGKLEFSRYAVRVLTSNTFTSIDAGGDHTCALTSDGRAFCWGANDSGQLGTGNRERALVPSAVQTTERFASLSAGWAHTCALTANGRAFCWGSTSDGQLGVNRASDATTPVALDTTLRFTRISAGSRQTCALALNGDAYCWGANELGQLGIGTVSGPRPPTRIAGFTFTGISAGWNHNCGVIASGLAYCWGENGYGEIGDGGKNEPGLPAALTPYQVANYGEISFVEISAGKHFTCGRRNQNSIYCWGRGSHGQLGNAMLEDRFNPQWVKPGPERMAVTTADVFAAIDAGDSHACALSISGTVFCWGNGDAGQLGNGERLSMIALPVLTVR